MERLPEGKEGFGVSVLTLAGKHILLPGGVHPDVILERAEQIGIIGLQWIPLRGFNDENGKNSGIEKRIITLEGIWGDPKALEIRVLDTLVFGINTKRAYELALRVRDSIQGVISIDVDGQSATEIADLPNRDIYEGREMVLDTYHARDLMVGRESAMRGVLPSWDQVRRVYREIFSKHPHIVAVQIQERNLDSLRQFLRRDPNSMFLFEIQELRRHLGEKALQIPVIVELHPFPLGLTQGILREKETTAFIKAVVEKIREVWYR